jgi:signal transduction histidine kinase
MSPVMASEGESLFGRRLFPTRDHAERVVAVVRLIFAIVSLVAIYLDPTSPARYVTLTYGLLMTYALCSLVLLIWLRATPVPSRSLVIVIHVGDVIAAAVLTLFTDGPSSPFFVLFGFILLSAGYQWGLWETLSTGIASVLLLGLEALLTSSWFAHGGVVEGEFELNRFILRCTYLLLLAVMVGYLAEHERRSRAEAGARGTADERARLARELHDGVIQSLIGLKMKMTILRTQHDDRQSRDVSVEEIEALLDREIVDLRSLTFALTPIGRDLAELSPVVADLVDQFGRATGITTRLVSTIESEDISPDTRREMARIVQEALVNVRKHSGARNVLVSLSSDGDHYRLVIDDDGRGFGFHGRLSHEELDRERKGPRVIKERVRLLGGSLSVRSRSDGARLEISVPRRT